MAISPYALWSLSQEARALLTRLARVRSFALVEPMLPAANLLPATQDAIERQLVLGAAVDPECVADAVPSLGETLLIGVGVLDGLPLQPVRVLGD